MNALSGQHPEYQQMAWGMQAGHLPASEQDIARVTGETFTKSPAKGASEGIQHPEFVEYREYARSLGYDVSGVR